MDMNAWFKERQHRTGFCRNCKKPYANVPGDDGELVDSMLEEWELFWDCRPVNLLADDPHSNAVLGEWCCEECFVQDVTGFFRASGWSEPQVAPDHEASSSPK